MSGRRFLKKLYGSILTAVSLFDTEKGVNAYAESWRVLLAAGIVLDEAKIKKSRGKRDDY